MQALNLEAEYRKYLDKNPGYHGSKDEYANDMMALGEWVEDDGNYYLPEVWATQYDEPQDVRCSECGNEAFVDGSGISHHSDDDEPEGIDHDKDADHVALIEE